MPVAEIAMLIGGATKAFNMCKAAVNAGRDLEDMGAYFARFFDAKTAIEEAAIHNEKGSKLLRGKSVEAEAMEIMLARKKYADMEKQLRELCMYTVGAEFYQEMLRERSRIRQERLAKAREQAERNRLVRDGTILAAITGCLAALVIWFVNTMR
jgi:hypothetical protein